MELVVGFVYFSGMVAILKLLVHTEDCLSDSESLNRQKERKINKRKDGVTLMTNSGALVFGTRV